MNKIGFLDIAEVLGLGKKFSSDENSEWLVLLD